MNVIWAIAWMSGNRRILGNSFSKTLIPIENPSGKQFTSLKRARELVRRGIAAWGDTGLRFKASGEICRDQAIRSEMRKDREYWDAVARQRGGVAADQLHYIIRKAATRPTMPGGPSGAAIMTFIPVIVRGMKNHVQRT